MFGIFSMKNSSHSTGKRFSFQEMILGKSNIHMKNVLNLATHHYQALKLNPRSKYTSQNYKTSRVKWERKSKGRGRVVARQPETRLCLSGLLCGNWSLIRGGDGMAKPGGEALSDSRRLQSCLLGQSRQSLP